MPVLMRSGGGGKKIKDATATPADVAAGKVFYNNNGKQTGTLPTYSGYQTLKSIIWNPSQLRLMGDIPKHGIYPTNVKMFIEATELKRALNISADKIVKGNMIAGVSGTAEIIKQSSFIMSDQNEKFTTTKQYDGELVLDKVNNDISFIKEYKNINTSYGTTQQYIYVIEPIGIEIMGIYTPLYFNKKDMLKDNFTDYNILVRGTSTSEHICEISIRTYSMNNNYNYVIALSPLSKPGYGDVNVTLKYY